MSQLDDSANGGDRAKRIGDVNNRDQTRASAQQLLILVEEKFAIITNRHDAQHRSGLFAQHLPGNNVGVMLHCREDDFIAGAKVGATPALGDEVNSLGGAPDEDDFARLSSAEKTTHL